MVSPTLIMKAGPAHRILRETFDASWHLNSNEGQHNMYMWAFFGRVTVQRRGQHKPFGCGSSGVMQCEEF